MKVKIAVGTGVSLPDEEDYHETEKISGRDMIRVAEGRYKKNKKATPFLS